MHYRLTGKQERIVHSERFDCDSIHGSRTSTETGSLGRKFPYSFVNCVDKRGANSELADARRLNHDAVSERRGNGWRLSTNL
jgi:hypothetical protein